MRKITFWQRLRYWFDNSLSGGTASLIAWLAAISLVVILISAIFLLVTGLALEEPYNLSEAFWQSLMRSIDPGTVAGDEGWSFRIWMLLITIFGIFIFSSLIGVLTSGLEDKLDDLRKGRSLVVEKDHTLILGWSPRIFLILSELCLANENAKKPRVVILANLDKVEMEEAIRSKLGNTGKTKIICRKGSPIDLEDLQIVNPQASKSIIVLSPEDKEDPDSHVIKMLLALTNSPNRREAPYHIVAEIRETENAKVTKMIGRGEVKLVLINDLISRITAQTCRQTGLSIVYNELLDFDGDEIYLENVPDLEGKTYGESLMAFEHCAVMGIARTNGKVLLNPSNDTKIEQGDEIVLIADDDEGIETSGSPEISDSVILEEPKPINEPENLLVLGWNKRGNRIVKELDNYVAKGSNLTVVSELPNTKRAVDRLALDATNLEIEFQEGDTTDRKLLNALDLPSYKHIIILCYSSDYEPQEADAKTIITLLHLRDIEGEKGDAYSIVSEMLDVKNRALAEVAQADDFIVSDELAGLLMTQISETELLGKVFDDLFDADGSEIYLKPAGDFVKLDEPVNFYSIVESARRRNESALGYKIDKESEEVGRYGIYVNPRKSKTVKFVEDDKIIVLTHK